MDECTFSRLRFRGHRREHHGEWAPARKMLFAMLLATVCQSAVAQVLYRIKPLGYVPGCTSGAPTAYGMNATDQVTGVACNANGDSHAFLWKNTGTSMVDLGPSEIGSTSTGYGVNASGLVAGTAQDSTGQYGFISKGNGSPMTKIPNGFGGTYTYAYGLNDSGQVTGEADNPSDFYIGDAFLWKNDGSPMRDIAMDPTYESYGLVVNKPGQVAGSQYDGDRSTNAFVWLNNGTPEISLAGGGEVPGSCCINDSGQVAGTFSAFGYAHPHAFVWRNDGTGMHDLGAPPRGDLSEAYAQNASGQVAGVWWKGYFKKQNAFVWLNNGTPMKGLGTLGGAESQSNDINASGQVTGWANTSSAAQHAFLWRNDGTTIQDLNALIDPTDPLKPYITLTNGNFIDAFGDVLAEGTDSRTGVGDLYLLQGTVLTLSPRTLAFGNQAINTTSAPKSVTMTNTSPKASAITSIALTGTAAGQFAETNNCGKSLAGHKTCTITVTFKPTTKGAKSESLNVNGGGGGLRVVALTGTGT